MGPAWSPPYNVIPWRNRGGWHSVHRLVPKEIHQGWYLHQHSSIKAFLLPCEGENEEGRKELEISLKHEELEKQFNTKTLFANSIILEFWIQFANVLFQCFCICIHELNSFPLVFFEQSFLGCIQDIVVSWCAIWPRFALPDLLAPFSTFFLT